MDYVSTRNGNNKVCSSFAIAHGISEEGGLFMPESIPLLKTEDFAKLREMNYTGRAAFILKKFLTDFSDEEINICVGNAYSNTFDSDNPAPLAVLGDRIEMLELWHGPTCAFKDLALQLLPHLLVTAVKKQSDGKKVVILVATSGDTGKAALEGFKDIDDTEIIVFYPVKGVSPMQKLQMTSQSGKNVHVYGINGNFDDAQTGVKRIFTDKKIIEILSTHGLEFSSANSINWGRLVPQIVYYVSAYCDMVNQGKDLTAGFNVVVPTGNFGNILAAYFARAMGTPINKLICASNGNNVLTDFINTGVYDKNRDFYATISPSMDILVSSNLERMLYILSDYDTDCVVQLQESLSKNGRFEISSSMRDRLSSVFYGGYCDDIETKATIKAVYEDFGYLCDTHTAVALGVYKKYVRATEDNTLTVIASTASPYKFAKSVIESIGGNVPDNDFEALEVLNKLTGVPVPKPIADLNGAQIRFSDVIEKNGLNEAVLSSLKI